MDFEKAKVLCRTFPGCTEDIKWGDNAVYSVSTKMFACSSVAVPAHCISFKADDERFLELSDRPGVVPAPYLARAKWVYIDSASALGDDETGQLLRRAYELIFAKLSKKLQREISGPN